ncbi:MAG: hypothetical protein J0M30_01610 [Chitinophagales bacterium]|nr:hypothetical protein [Chitinophagales bacterium]
MSELLNNEPNTKDREQLLNLLIAIDSEKRPLFAFILGLYIRENGITEELTQWNRIEQPLKYILAREERDWEKAPIWQRHSGLIGRTAIFMAAMGQNLSLSKLLQTIGTYLKNSDPIEQDAIAQLFRSTSHYREGIRDSYCLGLQPDLLAEYYVIRHFLRLNDPDESALLLNSTFKIDPEMVTSMLIKTEQNFRHHSGFEAVLYWLKEMVLHASLDVEQARELSRLINGFFQSNTPKETDRYNLPYILIFFEHLKHLQLSFPDDIELARTYTRSAHRYNYYFAAKKDPDPEQAFQYLLDYGVAMRGYQPFQTDPELALRQTTGARNVIYSLLVEKEKRSVDIFRCREIFETYIWELRKVDKFKNDREIQLETIKAIDLLIEGYTSRPISKPDQAVELINEYLDQLMNGEDFASDLAFAEFQLKCYYTLLYYYCYIDPQPSIKNGIHYYKKVAELFAKFKENDSIIQHRNLLQNLADTTSKFQRPPLWKKLENINGTNSLEKLNSDALLSDPTIWKIGEKIPIETWQKLYLPFLNQTPLYPDEQKLKNLLADAFEQSKYPPDIRYVKHIIGARAFKIPFYQNATLYQVLCKLDSWDRYLIGTGTRPGPGIGLINFIHAPGSSARFYWLTGLSTPIHDLNGHFNLSLHQPDLARDYLRYFCLMVQGESGSFTLMERIEDVFMVESQENDIAEKKLTEALNQNIPKPPEFDPEENAWYSNNLIAFGSALFKVQMKTKTFGPIEMLDDDPLLADLPICSIRFLEGLMYHFEPEEN